MENSTIEFERKAYHEFLDWKAKLAGKTARHELLFHSRVNPKMEIDFLIRRGIKTCPIEVKSAACRRHASLDALIERCQGKLGDKYVVCTEDYHDEGGITYLPFYMAHCL